MSSALVVGEGNTDEYFPGSFLPNCVEREFAGQLQRGGERVAVLLVERIDKGERL